jgi:VanZ family protein
MTIAVLVPYFIALLILAHIPEPELITKVHLLDKVIHSVVYMNLVFLLWFSINPDRKASWRNKTTWLIVFAAVAYGGIDELIQPYFGRTKDVWDFAANDAGVFAGLLIFTFLSFWQALLAVSAITVFGFTNLAKADLSKLMPFSNAVFHILAYGGFTLVWAKFMNLYLSFRNTVARLILAIGVPVCFMLIVKAGSVLLGRHFASSDLLFSFLAIIAVVTVSYLTGFLRPCQRPEGKGV